MRKILKNIDYIGVKCGGYKRANIQASYKSTKCACHPLLSLVEIKPCF